MVVGGDTVYVPVASFSGNKYFILKPDNIKNIFTVNNPEEAIKYIELAVVNLGWSTYDRVKKVVNKSEDYDTIGCRIMPEDQNNPLPASRPVSNAVKTPRGYEVTLVYFTPVNPAGYYTGAYLLGEDGSITAKEDNSKLFWKCGEGGIVF